MRARWPLALAAFCLSLLGAPSAARAEAGDDLTISVLTFGPGDHPFFKFGHNAILVHNARSRNGRADQVYNFGTFLFDSPLLIPVFLRGKLLDWLSSQSLGGTLAAYHHENRSIDAQELNLTPAQRLELATALEVNARDENKEYKYDYYRDNCSTRVRDAVDRVTGGRVKAASTAPARMTWRDHTMRLTADDLPIYLGLYVAMGSFIDQPITVWEEMFLPARLQETLRTVTIPGPNGDIPLVKKETTLLAAERAPLRAEPPHWTLRMGLVGALLGGGLAALGALGQKNRKARVAFGLVLAPVGFLLGLLGCIFLMFWLVTDHEVAYHNENILQCVPWALALVPASVRVALDRAGGIRRAFVLCRAAAVASGVGLVLKILPWFHQGNGQIIALLLPLWAGATYGLWRLGGGATRGLASPLLADETSSQPVRNP
jgi:hypothetical protein